MISSSRVSCIFPFSPRRLHGCQGKHESPSNHQFRHSSPPNVQGRWLDIITSTQQHISFSLTTLRHSVYRSQTVLAAAAELRQFYIRPQRPGTAKAETSCNVGTDSSLPHFDQTPAFLTDTILLEPRRSPTKPRTAPPTRVPAPEKEAQHRTSFRYSSPPPCAARQLSTVIPQRSSQHLISISKDSHLTRNVTASLSTAIDIRLVCQSKLPARVAPPFDPHATLRTPAKHPLRRTLIRCNGRSSRFRRRTEKRPTELWWNEWIRNCRRWWRKRRNRGPRSFRRCVIKLDPTVNERPRSREKASIVHRA